MAIGTAGWFFFYAIFALRHPAHDLFTASPGLLFRFYVFASSMFYPLEPLPRVSHHALRIPSLGRSLAAIHLHRIGNFHSILLEGVAFLSSRWLVLPTPCAACQQQE